MRAPASGRAGWRRAVRRPERPAGFDAGQGGGGLQARLRGRAAVVTDAYTLVPFSPKGSYRTGL
jgi:hypothetical protein